MNELVLPSLQRVASYATGKHLPRPYQDEAGQWRCADCLQRLRTYAYRGHRRLRHWPDREAS